MNLTYFEGCSNLLRRFYFGGCCDAEEIFLLLRARACPTTSFRLAGFAAKLRDDWHINVCFMQFCGRSMQLNISLKPLHARGNWPPDLHAGAEMLPSRPAAVHCGARSNTSLVEDNSVEIYSVCHAIHCRRAREHDAARRSAVCSPPDLSSRPDAPATLCRISLVITWTLFAANAQITKQAPLMCLGSRRSSTWP